MAGRIPLSLAAILLLAAPTAAGAAIFQVAGPAAGQDQNNGDPDLGQNQQGDQDDQSGVSDAQSFALVAGQILGAASACEQINEDRVSTATKKAVKITTDSAESAEDIQAAQQYMLDAADSARDAVKNGDADCDRVSASFSRLEQVEQSSQQQQSQLDNQNGSSGDQNDQDDQDDAE